MIYIDNNTTGFTIPRITNGIGDKVILINQITKRRFELSTDVLNDVGYKVDITDLKFEIGQYDYVVKKNNIPLESGILQVGGYKSQNNQYEVDFNIIQYEPDIVYTPLPEKVLNVTKNGVYDVESFDKVDVDVKDKESGIIIEQLENQIDTLEDEISTLEGTVSGLETEVNRLDDLKDSLQSQIDSVTTLSVTENGTYIPEEGILGWNEVNVNTKVVLGNDIKFGYSSFTEVPDYFDFSQTTQFDFLFYNCNKLISIPQLDTSNSTSFSSMFNTCSRLTTIPQLDTSNGTIFGQMFNQCNSLTTIPQLDTSKGTNFEYMFFSCTNLTTIPQLDTSKGTNFSYMFYNCKNLEEIEGELDFSKVKDNYGTNSTFSAYYSPNAKLVKVLFKGFINYNISFDGCSSLSYESVKSILTACSNTTNTNSKTVTFSRTLTDQNGELANLIATCNTKKWTVSGLTLE